MLGLFNTIVGVVILLLIGTSIVLFVIACRDGGVTTREHTSINTGGWRGGVTTHRFRPDNPVWLQRLGKTIMLLGLCVLLRVGPNPGLVAIIGHSGEGEIIAVKPVRRSGLRPTVRFITADGETVVFQGGTARNNPPYQVGRVVPIRYIAFAPTIAEVNSWSALWLHIVLLTPFIGGLVWFGRRIVRWATHP